MIYHTIRRILLFVACVSFIPLSGCFVGNVARDPGVSGRVVESDSGLPISGATVVRPCSGSKDKQHTGPDGRFTFVPVSDGKLFIVGNINPQAGSSSLGFDAPGYRGCCLELVVDRGSSATRDIGDIQLARSESISEASPEGSACRQRAGR